MFKELIFFTSQARTLDTQLVYDPKHVTFMKFFKNLKQTSVIYLKINAKQRKI